MIKSSQERKPEGLPPETWQRLRPRSGRAAAAGASPAASAPAAAAGASTSDSSSSASDPTRSDPEKGEKNTKDGGSERIKGG